MPPAFDIRLAGPEDADAIRELQWLLWDHHHALAPDRVLTADEIMAACPETPDPNDVQDLSLVAEAGREVLGWARLIVRDSPRSRAYPARKTLVLQAIAVRPQARRRGIGRALIERACVHAREHHAGTVQIPVLGFNTEALAFYRSLGFEDEFLLIGRPL